MAKVTFVSMWHAIAPASMELLRDELVALCQKEEKLEFWFHACHRDTSKWLFREITALKSRTQTPIEIVDVVDQLSIDWCIREPKEQLSSWERVCWNAPSTGASAITPWGRTRKPCWTSRRWNRTARTRPWRPPPGRCWKPLNRCPPRPPGNNPQTIPHFDSLEKMCSLA